MKKLTIIFLAGALLSLTATAQVNRTSLHTAEQPVRVRSYTAYKTADRINLDFTAEYSNIDLTPREELIARPVIVKGRDTLRLEPLVFRGKIYDEKLRRKKRLYDQTENYSAFNTEVFSRSEMREIRHNSDNPQSGVYSIAYRTSFPYMSWMDNSELYMEYETRGCGNQNGYMADMGVLYAPVAPQVLFVAPAVEAEKVRHDQMTSRIIFRVDKYDINPDIFNNAQELQRIYEFTENVITNKDVNVTNFRLTGYASPEASYAYNDRLSRNRVNALRDHIMRKYNLDRSKITTDNVPEDWKGVTEWVAESNIVHKNEVLNIISTTSDPDLRDGKIKALDNGQTYDMLLKEVYPLLRRVEYIIEYTVMPFTVEKGKEVLRTNPQHLSLDELYQIAGTYPVDSREYRDIFAVAVRNFPNDPVANNNMAAIAIREGDLEAARKYAEKGSSNPMSLNNMGIINALQGRYDEARDAFRRAMEMGSKEAAFNLENVYSLR